MEPHPIFKTIGDALWAAGVLTPEQRDVYDEVVQSTVDAEYQQSRVARARYDEYRAKLPWWKKIWP